VSLIKFPTQIKPSRVTVQLMRVDETVASPLTKHSASRVARQPGMEVDIRIYESQ
jgi:hypothetical protein